MYITLYYTNLCHFVLWMVLLLRGVCFRAVLKHFVRSFGRLLYWVHFVSFSCFFVCMCVCRKCVSIRKVKIVAITSTITTIHTLYFAFLSYPSRTEFSISAEIYRIYIVFPCMQCTCFDSIKTHQIGWAFSALIFFLALFHAGACQPMLIRFIYSIYVIVKHFAFYLVHIWMITVIYVHYPRQRRDCIWGEKKTPNTLNSHFRSATINNDSIDGEMQRMNEKRINLHGTSSMDLRKAAHCNDTIYTICIAACVRCLVKYKSLSNANDATPSEPPK